MKIEEITILNEVTGTTDFMKMDEPDNPADEPDNPGRERTPHSQLKEPTHHNKGEIPTIKREDTTEYRKLNDLYKFGNNRFNTSQEEK
jgi:hypothetical protein